MIRLWGHKSKSIALTVLLALFATLFTALPSSATDVAPTSISPSSLGTLYTNLTLNQPLEANGSPAAEITVSAGTLPDGITLSAGSILGTPITTGAYSFTLTATNTAGSFSQAYSGEITNGKPGSISPAQMPTLTAGSQSVVRFTTDGNPTGALTLASGTVPTGMTYSMGSISGTPTSPGAYSFTLRSTNAFGIKDVTYSGSVLQKAPTSITPATIGSIYTNAATAITFASNAIPSANFEVSAGTLPAGLSLDAATGQLTGTATTTGAYSFTIRISNDSGSLERIYSGQVTDGTPTVFTPSALPSIDATDSVSVQITADGNPAPTYAVQSGSLPTGLSLSSSGLLTGSTTATGAYSFTVRATNAGGFAEITYSGDIRPKAPSAITPTSLGNLYMTQSVNITIASVAYPSVALSISAGALPTGLSFDTGTGVISGTPTAAGAYSFTIDATQASSSTTISRTYSGVVRTGSITAITPGQIADIPGGIDYSLQLQSDSFPAATFAVTAGALPTGLTLSSAGLISGNPTTAGAFSFTVTGTATDTTTVAQSYSVNVIDAAPTQITPSAMPTFTAGTALTSPVQLTSNGLPSSTFSISAGTLPAGLALDGAAGVISGTPTNAGGYSFTVTATNSAGSTSKVYAGNVQSRTCPTATCVLDNTRIRFGTGSENSINQAGLVNQPWYFSAVDRQWKKLTYSNYPLNMAVSIGSSGSGYPRGNVTELSSQSGATMTNQDIDYREFVITNTAGGASIGFGKITVKGTFTNVRNQSNAVVSIEVTHIYELGQNDNFIKITTRVKNLDAASLDGVTVFVGTQDDWVGNTDRPTKVKGNLINGVFTPIATAADAASVLQITSGAEGVLFYSTTAGVNMSMTNYGAFSNAYSVNPTVSPITLTNDGSYAAHLPFGVVASAATSELTWYYAAGATSDLSAVTQAIASAAAPVAPRVARGNGQGTLTWEVPVSTDPIVNYTVRYKATTDSGWTNVPLRSPASTDTSEVVTGLVNGNTYIFQVAAISYSASANINVTGAWSATSAPALIGYPDAPTITSVTGANGQVNISLTPGQSEASPILGYDYSVDGGVTWISIEPADPTMTSYTITGLPNGGAYQIQLRARNVYGASTASNTYEAYTNPVWIDRFLNGIVIGLPYNDGIVAGANISNYSISVGTLPAGLTLNTSTGTITGTPTAVGAYSFTISAQNGAATLSQSFSGTVTDFGFNPATPSFNLDVSSPFSATIFGSDSVGVALSPTGATFSWVSGSLPNGVTATFVSNGVYGVYPNVSFSGQPTATGTFTRVLRLTDGTGRTSDVTLTFTVVRALSGQPTLGSPTLSGDTITVPFTEGAAGSTPVTSYQYSLDNGVTWITYTGGTTSPLVIAGLTDGSFYQIKIRAVNDAGPSMASTAFDLLMNPGFSVRTLSPFVKDVAFTSGLTAGYQVTYTITGTLPTGVTFDATTGQFSGTPTTLEAYSFVVRATNATGFTELTFTGSVVSGSSGVETVAVSPKALPRLAPITSESGKTPGEISSLEGKDNVKGGPVLKVNADSLAIEAPDWTITIQALSPDGKTVAPTSTGGLTVEANHKVDLGGRGFLAGSMVAFYVMSTPIFLGELEVTADGKFAGSLPLPAGLELGKHTLQIRGYSPDRDTRAVSLGFVLIEKRVQTKTFKFEVRFKPNSSVVDNASKLALLKIIRQVPQSAMNSKLVIAGSALDYQKSIAGTIAKKRVDSVLKIVRSAPVKLQPFKSVSVVPAKVGPSGRAAKLNLTFSYSVVIGG